MAVCLVVVGLHLVYREFTVYRVTNKRARVRLISVSASEHLGCRGLKSVIVIFILLEESCSQIMNFLTE